MKRVFGLLAALSLLTLAFATAAFAQQQAEGVVVKQQRLIQGPEGAPPPPDANVWFMASESFGGKTVKGAPYSADAVTETIQTLGDGNRIINRITSSVYRDGEGRTRREQTLKGLGIPGMGDEPLQTIFINDPVAGVTYALDTRTQTAHKSMTFTFELAGKQGIEGAQRFEFKVAPGTAVTGTTTRSMILTTPMGAPPAGAPMPPPDVDHFTMRTEGGVAGTYVFKTFPGANNNAVQEQLGKQTIEGVEAEGTRTTITIPAGEIGNERAIEIVSERWYSPELQLVVMSRHSDPRTGEATYKLTNINRTEPAKALFEVPPGYTIKDGPQFAPPISLPRTRKPANPEE
ncbi:MAG TPA: hypothetical protein VHS05_22755 [Pyrinomonadaceae bacterium]|nr:hypothetical protein [Pyrinomonadaceae bacterium]